MKAVSILVLFCLIAFSCSQDESKVIKTGSISFSLSQKARANGRVADAGNPASVLLTIKDSNGNVVYENKKLQLFTFGQGYTSESLQLNIGSYTLTQFVVLDASDKALYATPLQNSDLAKYVSTPLPVSFAVSDNSTTSVVPEVLPVMQEDKPEAFGYASFGFTVVNPRLKEVIVNDQAPYKVLYHYQGNSISQIEMIDISAGTAQQSFNYSYNAQNQLVKRDFYQSGVISETTLYQYDNAGQLIFIHGSVDQKMTYSNGILIQMNVSPGYLSQKEKVDYEYNIGGDISKMTITGYDQNDNIKWITTNVYYYDQSKSLSGEMPVWFYQASNTYVLPNINYFANLKLTHNIIRMETSTYFSYMGGNVPPKEIFYSEMTYDNGLLVREVFHNDGNVGYFPIGATLKEYTYQ